LKSLIIIFGALLLIIATPFVFTAIDNSITDEYTQSFAGVATGGATYIEDVTLGRAMYNDDTSSVSSISSNDTDDSPTADSYNSVSRVLTVSGLDASTTRTLTIVFMIDSPTLPTGAASFLALFRWFFVFIVIGMAGGAIYAFFD